MLIIKQPVQTILLLLLLWGLASCGGGSNSDPTSPKVTRIELQVNQDAVLTNSSTDVTVIAYYDNNTNENITQKVDWSVSDDRLASIDQNGELHTNFFIDSVEVIARYNNLSISKTFQITQSPGSILSELIIDAEIAKNLAANQEVSVSAKYNDGSIKENIMVSVESVIPQQSSISSRVVFSLASTEVTIDIPQTIDTTSSLTVAAVSAPVSAVENSVVIKGINIIADQTSLLPGEKSSISLNATYSDDSTAILNTAINWSVSGPITLSSDNSSLIAQDVTATTSATLSAEVEGISATQNFTINPIPTTDVNAQASLESISIQVGKSKLFANETTSISAIGSYSDSSTLDITQIINWSSANTNIAHVDSTNGKVIPGSETGTTTLTASVGNISKSIDITVDPAAITLSNLTLNQTNINLKVGDKFSLSATGTYSDNHPENLTPVASWSSNNIAIATVDSKGVVTAVSTGKANITASYQGKNAATEIIVEQVAATLSKISINSGKLNLNTLESLPVTAIGTYSNNTTADITSTVKWESSAPNVISVNSGSNVKLTALDIDGSATISASLGAITQSQEFTVSKAVAATLTNIHFDQGPVSLTTNAEPYSLQVYADYSNNTKIDISNQVTWSSSKPEIVAVNKNGILTTAALTGDAIITATENQTGFFATIAVSVIKPIAANIQSVYVSNTTSTLFFNHDSTMILHGVLSDNSEIVLQQNIVWNIKNYDVNVAAAPLAKINSAGIVTANNIAGYVSVTASYTDVTTGKVFADPLGITIHILPENSFDSLNIKLADLPQRTFVEDNSNVAPEIKAFYNPVGITEDIAFTSAYPGTFISYKNTLTSERLALVLNNSTSGDFDKSNAKLFYVTENNKDVIYALDETINTSLTVSLITYGSIGGIASGQFSAVLCLENAIASNNCNLVSNQLKLSGSFYLTIDSDAVFISHYSAEEPALLHAGNMNIVKQISTVSNYHYENTTKGVTYHFKSDNNNVLIDVIDSSNKSTILASSTPRSSVSGNEVTYTANETKTFLKLTYTGSDKGTTYKVSNSTDGLVAQGSAANPLLIGQRIPLFNYGTVDTTSSYYQIDVLAGHKFIVNFTNITLYSKITLEVSDNNNVGNYTSCTLTKCEVESLTGKLFLKVTGDSTIGTSYDIRVEYSPEQEVTLFLPVVDRIGQVSYYQPNSPQDGPFSLDTSNYWVDTSTLLPNTHYLISIKGLTDFTRMYINDPNLTLAEQCASGGTWNAPATQNTDQNLNEIYCVVKTNNFIRSGFAINIVGGYFGTPFTLNVSTINAAQVYYVSTYGNGATTIPQPLAAMSFYHPGEEKPFTFTLFTADNFAKKALVLAPGETILIRIFDVVSTGNFYSMKIQKNGFKTTSSNVRNISDPDEYESGSGDNSAVTATLIELNQETSHSFSNNNKQFGDEDWFKFTAPLQ